MPEQNSRDALFADVHVILEGIASNHDDLLACGKAAAQQLDLGLEALLDQADTSLALSCFQALLDLADESILSYHFSSVPACWRRLYTDATLLKVISLLLATGSSARDRVEYFEHSWRQAIRDLDKALIVAGSPGPHRQAWTHTLISIVQKLHLPLKRRDVHVTDRSAISAKSPSDYVIDNPIPRFEPEEAPSMEDFVASSSQRPFIVSGGVTSWPAYGRWSSLDTFRQAAGEGRVVPIEVGGTYTQENWSQELMDFGSFLDMLSSSAAATAGSQGGSQASSGTLYLAQHDLLRQIPQLEDDFWPPDYVYMAPSAPPDAPSYVPPDADRGYLVNLWIGPEDTHSPAHTDPYFNCYGQVVGRKLLWVAPPAVSRAMYPFGAPEEPFIDINSTDTTDEPSKEGLQEQYMGNTTQVDVLATCERSTSDEELKRAQLRFPRFFETARPASLQAILEPGDLLVMPPGWWHSLKSLDTAMSVSLWF